MQLRDSTYNKAVLCVCVDSHPVKQQQHFLVTSVLTHATVSVDCVADSQRGVQPCSLCCCRPWQTIFPSDDDIQFSHSSALLCRLVAAVLSKQIWAFFMEEIDSGKSPVDIVETRWICHTISYILSQFLQSYKKLRALSSSAFLLLELK